MSRHRFVAVYLVFLMAWQLGGCAPKIATKEITLGANSGVDIRSVAVEDFQGNYGKQLAELIKGDLARENYIRVVNQGGEATLSGTINVGRIQDDSYYRSREYEDKKGRKETVTTYYYVKKLNVTATYSLEKNGASIAGKSIPLDYFQEWQGQSAAEARSMAASDDQMISAALGQLAGQIVTDISPHKSSLSFALQTCSEKVLGVDTGLGGHDGLKLGVDYYQQGLYPQAMEYWKQVADQEKEPKCQAAAWYNLGVNEVREGRFREAFEMFKQADALEPGNVVYMQALRNADEAGWREKEKAAKGWTQLAGGEGVESRGKSVKSVKKYSLTVNTTPADSTVKIMNIAPKYYPGIELIPNKYKVRVEAPGYKTKNQTVPVKDQDVTVDIVLEKE